MKNLTVTIADDVYAKARRKAAQADTSVSQVVAEYLRLWISKADAKTNRRRRLKRLFQALDARHQDQPAKPLSRHEIYAGRVR